MKRSKEPANDAEYSMMISLKESIDERNRLQREESMIFAAEPKSTQNNGASEVHANFVAHADITGDRINNVCFRVS